MTYKVTLNEHLETLDQNSKMSEVEFVILSIVE